MTIICRYRAIRDDIHHIRNPYGSKEDMAIFANTLAKKRIPDLFQTQARLAGHVQQIQQELNRLAATRGHSAEMIEQAIHTSRFIRSSLQKSKEQAIANNFPFTGNWQSHDYLSAA